MAAAVGARSAARVGSDDTVGSDTVGGAGWALALATATSNGTDSPNTTPLNLVIFPRRSSAEAPATTEPRAFHCGAATCSGRSADLIISEPARGEGRPVRP